MPESVYWICKYCENRVAKGLTVFAPELHYRMYHLGKFIIKEVKEGTTFISKEEYDIRKSREKGDDEEKRMKQRQEYEKEQNQFEAIAEGQDLL